MSQQSPLSSRLRRIEHAPWHGLRHTLWCAAMAVGLSACADPREVPLVETSAIGKPAVAAPWQPQLSLADVSRRLSDGEGEIVVAGAIAAHEMRRP